MKKLRCLLQLALVVVLFAACGQEESNNVTSSVTVNDVISSQVAAEESQDEAEQTKENIASSDAEEQNEENVAESEESDVADAADIDLTDLSSTMIYGEIYNMVTTPMLYHGKTVKLTGYYDEYYDIMTDTRYCSVFVLDALACCAQGLQIEFSEEYSYPDDYPLDGDEITIYATFEIYYPDPDSKVFYYHLVDTVVVD